MERNYSGLVVFIEPAPYMVQLIKSLQEKWHGSLFPYFIESNATQNWQNDPAKETYSILSSNPIKRALQITNLIYSKRPNLVYIAGWSHPLIIWIIFFSKLMDVKVIANSDTWTSLSTGFRLKLKKYTLRRIDYFTPGGSRQVKYLMGLGVPAKKIYKSNMTVDIKSIRTFMKDNNEALRTKIRSLYGISDSCVHFLFVGRMEPVKGPDIALEAFLKSKLTKDKAHLTLVGNGSLHKTLQQQASNTHNIMFPGRMDGENLWSHYLSADVIIAPSRSEAWGLVVNEAMAANLPVIVSDCFGCIDDLVIPNKTGIIFKTGDIEDLSEHITKLVANKKSLKNMGAEASKHINDWTIENQADKIVSAWKESLCL